MFGLQTSVQLKCVFKKGAEYKLDDSDLLLPQLINFSKGEKFKTNILIAFLEGDPGSGKSLTLFELQKQLIITENWNTQ